MPVPSRIAEVIIHQIMEDCVVNSSVFYGPKDRISGPSCKFCRAGVKETAEHIIIRCTGCKEVAKLSTLATF